MNWKEKLKTALVVLWVVCMLVVGIHSAYKRLTWDHVLPFGWTIRPVDRRSEAAER